MISYNESNDFQVGEILCNIETKELFEIIEYVPEIEYNIQHIYVLKSLESDKRFEFTKGYMIFKMESMNTIDRKIENYNKLVNEYSGNISDLRWLKSEMLNKLKQSEIAERITKR